MAETNIFHFLHFLLFLLHCLVAVKSSVVLAFYMSMSFSARAREGFSSEPCLCLSRLIWLVDVGQLPSKKTPKSSTNDRIINNVLYWGVFPPASFLCPAGPTGTTTQTVSLGFFYSTCGPDLAEMVPKLNHSGSIHILMSATWAFVSSTLFTWRTLVGGTIWKWFTWSF